MHSAMEQTRYWMWTRRKFGGRPHLNSSTPSIATASYNESWEEQAFAEDSAGLLGGCIWPPRSYSCSFCRREFRSAQALGGHMNVHRRDRARLKQSPGPSENHNNNHTQQLNPCTAMGTQYPSQVCTLVYNNNPNPSIVASPLSPSRVSAASIQENYEHTLVSPSYSSSIIQERRKGSLFSTPDQSLSDSIAVRLLNVPELKLGREKLRPREVVFRRKRDSGEDDEEEMSSKRRRNDEVFPLFVRPASGDRHHLQSEVLKLGPSPIEELDLELRLGDRPKVM